MLGNEKCTTTFFKVVLEQSSIRERIPSMAFLDGSIGMPQTARSDVACSKDNKLKLALIHVQLACKWHQTLLGGVSCTPVHGNIGKNAGNNIWGAPQRAPTEHYTILYYMRGRASVHGTFTLRWQWRIAL